MKTVRCTASALKLRSRPVIDPDTDTGLRLVHGQSAIAYGCTWDEAWYYVEAPAGSGWASSDYLVVSPAAPALPAWGRIPHGLIDLRSVYGDPTSHVRDDGSIAPEWERRVTEGRVRFPAPLPLSWAPSQLVRGFSCHPLVADRYQSAFDEVHRRGYWHLLEDFGGCYNWRTARGLTKLSTHAWGIAIDVAVGRNPLGARPTLDGRIVAIFEDHGFQWGGRWSRPDGMHFQAVTGY